MNSQMSARDKCRDKANEARQTSGHASGDAQGSDARLHASARASSPVHTASRTKGAANRSSPAAASGAAPTTHATPDQLDDHTQLPDAGSPTHILNKRTENGAPRLPSISPKSRRRGREAAGRTSNPSSRATSPTRSGMVVPLPSVLVGSASPLTIYGSAAESDETDIVTA